MKRILGLDLGTNSIGWALVEVIDKEKTVKTIALGSRIIPMDAVEKSAFEEGGTLVSAASQRTSYRSSRRQLERFLLRRNRLHLVLNVLDLLPEHYKKLIDFDKKKGQFKEETDEKLAYVSEKVEGKIKLKYSFLFMNSYEEMKEDFLKHNPAFFKDRKDGENSNIPYDWTLYYLRQKALAGGKITKAELAWIILSYNQKRGYEKTLGDTDKNHDSKKNIETFIAKVVNVEIVSKNKNKVTLADPDTGISNNNTLYFEYIEETETVITQLGDLKEFERITEVDDNGNEIKKEYKINELLNLKVVDVIDENSEYIIKLETGWEIVKKTKQKPEWKNSIRDFIVSTPYYENGTEVKTQDGNSKKSIKSPDDNDWNLVKLRTANRLDKHIAGDFKNKGPATFLYNNLLKKPNGRLKRENGLITVIDRKYYENELREILIKQKDLINIDDLKFYNLVKLLYPNNSNRRDILLKGNIIDIIVDDVIFYQRDLKSKKSLISNCRYEKRNFKGKVVSLKAIHKAHPLYQEFRLWKLIKDLRIQHIGDKNNEDKSLSIEEKESLFEFLNGKNQVNEEQILNYLKLSAKEYKWNYTSREEGKEYEADKEYKPCNSTRFEFLTRLKRITGFDYTTFLTQENEIKLWHFIYSVNNAEQYKKGLITLFKKLSVEEKYLPEIRNQFLNFPRFKNEYANYSEKAIKKLLPLMRLGKYWSHENVLLYRERLDQILSRWQAIDYDYERINEIIDDEICKGSFTSFFSVEEGFELQDLAEFQACYLIYNHYSEVGEISYWKSPNDIKHFLKEEFRQHSLRNPVVEKVLREMLQIVKDIWELYGSSQEKYFTEIHIEMTREIQNTKAKREKLNAQNKKNQKANRLIRRLLTELKDANENSEQHQSKLKIIEDGAWLSIRDDGDKEEYEFAGRKGTITKKELIRIRNSDNIKPDDIIRYKLWLEQRYQSPYTGKVIRLSDLFNKSRYEIEHIFPKDRINLDEFSNKVVCETEVNSLKNTKTGLEFIKNPGRKTVFCEAYNSEVDILSEAAYKDLVNRIYVKKKKEILLSEKIPAKFTNAQKQNTAYITKEAMKLLSNVVREAADDSYKAKNVILINGKLTSILKRDWNLNNVWNRIILPRFERLNDLYNTDIYTKNIVANGHNITIPIIPKNNKRPVEKKRIDHRHHALDALIVALATQDHINYINNQFGESREGKDIKYYRNKLTHKIDDGLEGKSRRYKLPYAWENFHYELNGEQNRFHEIVFNALQSVVVSFKHDNRILAKSSNKYWSYYNEDGKLRTGKAGRPKKGLIKQKKGNNLVIKKALHTEQVYGKHLYDFEVLKWYENFNKIDFIVDGEFKIRVSQILSLYNGQTEAIKKSKYWVNKIERVLIDIEKIKLDKLSITNEPYKIGQLDKEIQELEDFIEKNAGRILIVNNQVIEKIAYSEKVEKYRKRVPIFKMADRGQQAYFKDKEGAIKFINNIADRVIREDLMKHLIEDNYDIDKAFSLDGIDRFNKKRRIPVYRLPKAEKSEKKFSIGNKKSNSSKYGETVTNPYFVVYEYKNEEGIERVFKTISLNVAISNLKETGIPMPERYIDEKHKKIFVLKYYLSPYDLVYVPFENEQVNTIDYKRLTSEQKDRIFAVNDFSGQTCYFTPNRIANSIGPKEVDLKRDNKKNTLSGSYHTKTATFEGVSIKEKCVKLIVDRLGNITHEK